MSLTFKDVAELIKLIDASNCEEVVLDLAGARLVVRRGAPGAPTGGPLAPSSAAAPATAPTGVAAEPAATPGAAGKGAAANPEAGDAAGATDVRAPMVGTFYRRPAPDQPNFVEEGARVSKGDTLCLIEVMKLFTAVEAPADGVVVSIGPADGALVEFDQLLFKIAP